MAADDSYDSDGGLEEISIGDSNKQLIEKWYSVTKHLKSEKEKVKEKRRKHHLLCAQQKNSKSEVRIKSSDKDSPQKVEKKAKRVKFDDDDADDEDIVAETEKSSAKPFSEEGGIDCSVEEDDANKSSEDFIAFDKKNGGVKPVCLRDLMKVDPGLESALAFKNKHLFGRHVHRQPMSSHLAMAEKRRARYAKQTNSTT